jgi:hypothetical protein
MAYVPYDPNRPKQKPKDLNAQDVDTWKDAEAAKDRFARQVKGAKADLSAVDVNPYTAKRAMPSTRQASTSMPKSKTVTTPIKLTSRVDMPKSTSISVKAPVDNSGPKGAASTADSGAGTAFAKQYAENKTVAKGFKDLAETETRSRGNDKYKNAHNFSGDTSLDLSNPKSKSDAGPKAKPVVKAAPKVKSQFERMQDDYEGFGKGSDSAANKEIQARLKQGSKSASTKLATPEKTSVGAGAAFAKGAKGAMKKGGSACKGYAKGGSVKSSAASRGDGCATKGHTKGAMR